jgi:SAM-dependent methyltransferase
MRPSNGPSPLPPTIEDVRRFWDAHPLWTGEASHAAGTPAFFAEHRRVYYQDCFAGRLDPRLFPRALGSKRVLDLGCGIGFWLVEFWERGCRDLVGTDLSPRSLEIAAQRCALDDIACELRSGNAEALPFADASFDHVNCQGMIHHTPSPERVGREIHRVLRPGGSALVSAYYRNALLRNWPFWRLVLRGIPIGLEGRGRSELAQIADPDEIVRRYDGAANPIGRCYGRTELVKLLHPLQVRELFFHFFPARALPFALPLPVHRLLDRATPFMIFARCHKV